MTMERHEFKAESKRLLDLMIHSIYTHKEIFLRELISNASDAIDKLYYKALTDENIRFNKEDYYIRIEAEKEARLLKVTDTGIGMSRRELEENLGVIAKSGSLHFKQENEVREEIDIIGQFGVGFYSAFMVSDTVTVISREFGSQTAYRWESSGAEGYTIEETQKEEPGTQIILKIKENTEEENYDEFLDVYRLRSIIKKYSDFIRYPIRMEMPSSRPKEDNPEEWEEILEDKIINSMVPMWRKNKSELTDEDYDNFYSEKHYGFDKPLRHIHISADGAVRYQAVLYIPQKTPFDFYTKEYEKGLELYASGVLIMNKCAELLPDYFSFVKGMVDSEDLSLNISRELLQHDRQLKVIAKRIREKIKSELLLMMENDREKYEEFYESFGRQIKYGVYSDFGANKEILQDLLMFYSSVEKKPVTLKEYISRMKEEQKYIYYASGESKERIARLPQTERLSDLGYEILYFTDEVDEFAIKMLRSYDEKEFRSVSGSDLGIEEKDGKEEETADQENKDLFAYMKEVLGEKVKAVKASSRLKNHPVCLSAEGELSIEMEKTLRMMPGAGDVQAEKVLEINTGHPLFEKLQSSFAQDRDLTKRYTELLYDQALLIEGLPIEDPVEYSNTIWQLLS